ncbi:MerR family transcriptional regulator [Paenibacillus vietnamensis]|uniref:MerR family transcriptional regulator n=1 Tax=Paenibacillus vietnamensis TaxID=2590547 RepID=UPI001CD09F85|nr:MerR family transcriptional regulator [Paenibacillus vietnamensis]
MNLLKIEEVARRTGLTKRTIRYYEEIGLIAAPERTQGNIRLYTEEDVERIQSILLIKEVLGFSLQELQQYLSYQELLDQQKLEYRSLEDREERKHKLNEILAVIRKEQAMIEAKLARMEQFRRELNGYETRVLNGLKQLEE